MTLLVVVFSFIQFFIFQKDIEKIQWNSDLKLKWSQFKGKTDSISRESAAVKTRIEVNVIAKNDIIKFNIPCYFEINKSWTLTNDSLVLIHEQVHFDIAEVAARNLRKIISEYRFTKGTDVKKTIKELYQKNIKFLVAYQTRYDEETGHSRKLINQKVWNLRVSELLKNLEEYKQSTFVLKTDI